MPPSFKLPVLETDRLRLRGHRPDDLADCARMWADPVVTRFIGGRPFSQEEVWARILRYVGHWSWFAFGYWLVEEKASGQLVGEVGFADYRREIETSMDATPELGWALATTMTGRGYSTEAVLAAVAWFEHNFQPARTMCLIAPENIASIRVATKCGYQKLKLSTYRGQPTLIYTRDTTREIAQLPTTFRS